MGELDGNVETIFYGNDEGNPMICIYFVKGRLIPKPWRFSNYADT
jgi:hypothetical protein